MAALNALAPSKLGAAKNIPSVGEWGVEGAEGKRIKGTLWTSKLTAFFEFLLCILFFNGNLANGKGGGVGAIGAVDDLGAMDEVGIGAVGLAAMIGGIIHFPPQITFNLPWHCPSSNFEANFAQFGLHFLFLQKHSIFLNLFGSPSM